VREIYTKKLRNFSDKLAAKCPSITLGYSMVRIFSLDDSLLELEASPVGGQQL